MNITQQTKKWGNSTAIRLPKKVLQGAGWQNGQTVVFGVKGKTITLSPIKATAVASNPKLEDLLKGVTPDKIRGEMDWGEDSGLEIIDG